MIRFNCPVCPKRLKAPEDAVGRRFVCPKCLTAGTVPTPAPAPPPFDPTPIFLSLDPDPVPEPSQLPPAVAVEPSRAKPLTCTRANLRPASSIPAKSPPNPLTGYRWVVAAAAVAVVLSIVGVIISIESNTSPAPLPQATASSPAEYKAEHKPADEPMAVSTEQSAERLEGFGDGNKAQPPRVGGARYTGNGAALPPPEPRD